MNSSKRFFPPIRKSSNLYRDATERDATLVVGADDDFEDLPFEIELSQFRTGPV